MSKSDKVISFRLNGDVLEQIEDSAKRRAVSVNELARETLLAALSADEDSHRMALRVTAIEGELLELRRDLAVATQAILVTAGKVPPEEAEKFAREKLRKV